MVRAKPADFSLHGVAVYAPEFRQASLYFLVFRNTAHFQRFNGFTIFQEFDAATVAFEYQRWIDRTDLHSTKNKYD
jgi:hypothetical protein